jgi:predicted transcriptional regulator
MDRSQYFTVSLPTDIRAELERVADEEDRTISYVIRRLLRDGLNLDAKPATPRPR